MRLHEVKAQRGRDLVAPVSCSPRSLSAFGAFSAAAQRAREGIGIVREHCAAASGASTLSWETHGTRSSMRGWFKHVARHANRAELRFRPGDQIVQELREMRDAGAKCCAFLRLELTEQHDATLLSIASANPDGVFMIDELANAFAAD